MLFMTHLHMSFKKDVRLCFSYLHLASALRWLQNKAAQDNQGQFKVDLAAI